MPNDLESLKARKAALEKRIREVRVRESRKRRKEDVRRKLIVGAAMLEAVQIGRINENVLEALLREFVTKPSDRAFLQLDEPKSEA